MCNQDSANYFYRRKILAAYPNGALPSTLHPALAATVESAVSHPRSAYNINATVLSMKIRAFTPSRAVVVLAVVVEEVGDGGLRHVVVEVDDLVGLGDVAKGVLDLSGRTALPCI